jgi:phage shock protein A
MPANRTFPQVQSIKDNPTRESLRQAWNAIHDHKDDSTAHDTEIAALTAKIATLEAAISKLQTQISQAIFKSGDTPTT